jgi:beta-glucosidase
MGTVTPELEKRARELRDQLTLDEKVRMLSGSKHFYPFILGSPDSDQNDGKVMAADVPRLGIKGFVCSDGPRGITRGPCTCFPVPIARAATFSPELEERVGEAAGREARAIGVDLVLAPCVNVLRHPAWGRAQETYGEDPGLSGDMGAAFTRGVQKHALACVKHFACNSIERSRLKVDVRIGEEALHQVYLPAFEQVVRAGVASVMSAYNSVNGQWCSQNRRLLTDILKDKWDFDGFVESDWIFGVHDGPAAVRAGLDLEMPSPVMLGKRLLRAVKRGRVPLERIDDAVLRLLRQQLRAAQLGDGDYGPEVIAGDKHRALAREVATRAIVLLRNERVVAAGAAPARGGAAAPQPVLPLKAKELKRLAVIGRLADSPNLGDKGSSGVNPPSTVTPLEGLRTALKSTKVEVVYDDGSDPARAAALAAGADAAVVVVGYDHNDEGEYLQSGFPLWFTRRLSLPPWWALQRIAKRVAARQLLPPDFAKGGDRKSLTLHTEDEDLLLAVAAVNPRTVAALVAGSAVLMERWREVVPAILMLWYPGMEGGHALADVLLGSEKPTGRLPFAIPTSAEHLPLFDNKAKRVVYGPLHGQPWLDHLGVQAAFPFGFGLTYE